MGSKQLHDLTKLLRDYTTYEIKLNGPKIKRFMPRLVKDIASICADNNPRFDWQRFIEACEPKAKKS